MVMTAHHLVRSYKEEAIIDNQGESLEQEVSPCILFQCRKSICVLQTIKGVVNIDPACGRDRGYHCLFVLMYPRIDPSG
jgi:hypothetical protein